MLAREIGDHYVGGVSFLAVHCFVKQQRNRCEVLQNLAEGGQLVRRGFSSGLGLLAASAHYTLQQN
jgi:hypothetical protein